MKYGIKIDSCAENWEEGFFLGNGSFGGIFFCRPSDEKIIFNQESMFLHTTEIENFPHMADVFSKAREAYENGNAVAFAEEFFSTARERGLRNRIKKDDVTIYPDSYFPPFASSVKYDCGDSSDYVRVLDTSCGEMTVGFLSAAGRITERAFASLADGMVYVKFDSESPLGFRVSLSLPDMMSEGDVRLRDMCVLETETAVSGNAVIFRVQTNSFGYSCRVRVFSDGETMPDGDAVRIEGRTATLVYDFVKDGDFGSGGCTDYDTALAAHAEIYREKFFRQKIEFKENPYCDETVGRLFENTGIPSVKAALMQKLYYMGRYSTIASYGKLPPNSQGLWSGMWNGRTFCDYISNIELEMAFAPLFCGNFFEYASVCFDFIESFIDDFRENARSFFGCRGIMVTSRFTTSGKLLHFSSGYCHEFWISGAAWLSELYYDYYLYTGDKKFLSERAMKFMCEAADFYMDYVGGAAI